MIKTISDEYVYKKKLTGRSLIMVLQYRLGIRWYSAKLLDVLSSEVNPRM